jgi:UDP-GlcNAc:undecaprenyl-phosphate/decaprenyl-phosphate GlcNAc-1-phosphate transferase
MMGFPFNFYVAAFAAGLIVAFGSLPLWKRFCQKVGLMDDPGHRKIHEATIPLAGGLAVFTGIVLPLLIGAVLVHLGALSDASTEPLRYGFGRRVWQLAGILTGATGMLALGIADDKWELKPGLKFAGQCAIALLVAASGVRITLFVPNLAFSYFITVLWILTLVNAFNFMDNMNGLCGGLGAIAAWLFALLASLDGQYLIALFSFLVAGALIGFLPHNFPRPRPFWVMPEVIWSAFSWPCSRSCRISTPPGTPGSWRCFVRS